MAVLDSTGEVQVERSVSTQTPEELVTYLDPFRPLHVVVETCPFWPWLYDLLVPLGIAFHLAHARELRAIAAAPQKTDEADARLLARMFLAGVLPEAYPRPADQRDVLRLLRHRTMLVRFRTRLAGRIHSQLHQQRIQLPREQVLRQHTRAWFATDVMPQLTAEQQAIVTSHCQLIDELTPRIHTLERRIRAQAATHPVATLLATVPGIGPYRSLLLATELAPVTRFPTAAHVVSYAGLAPTTRSSGGHTWHGGIPRGANRWVRGALVSAIPSHVRCAPDSPVTTAYAHWKARRGWRVARVAAARKLLRILYTLWRCQEPWRSAA